ncbi:hypothetical protein AVEN_111851-1 [Araneus ventricosus]|uniref:Uncharacterized protein n=1 Tax=Araneus ventricosus TaxID=182803 RepID=A0A4Y2BYZ5_ARAVE|nr:hypothetical protein AVEN_111851-1 [Araneus ventricosus]
MSGPRVFSGWDSSRFCGWDENFASLSPSKNERTPEVGCYAPTSPSTLGVIGGFRLRPPNPRDVSNVVNSANCGCFLMDLLG